MSSNVTAIFSREISERRMIFPAAAILAFLPFVAHLIPGLSHKGAIDSRAVLALIVSLAFGAGTAMVLGANMFSRDIAERKLGFYLSHPIGSISLWSGKVLAAWFLALAGAFIVLIPSLIGGLASWKSGIDVQPFSLTLLIAAAVIILVPLSHAITTAMRSRSAWILLDIVAASLLGAWVYVSARRIFQTFAFEALVVSLGALFVASFFALLASGAIQIEKGRNEIRRSHRSLSLAFWSAALILGLAFDLSSRWVANPSFADLDGTVNVVAAPRGDWAAVVGPVKHRGNDHFAMFLLNVATKQARRLDAAGSWNSEMIFSADGRAGLFVRPHIEGFPNQYLSGRLVYLDLATGSQRFLPELPTPWVWSLALSSDGARGAYGTTQGVTVLDTATGRTLAVAQVNGDPVALAFLPDGRLRIASRIKTDGMYQIALRQLDIAARRVSPATILPFASKQRIVASFNSTGAEIVIRSGADGRIFDASGRELVEITRAVESRRSASFLSKDRIAIVETREKSPTILSLLEPDGTVTRTVSLPPGGSALVGEELTPSLVLVQISSDLKGGRESTRLYVVNLDSGTYTEKRSGLTFVWQNGGYDRHAEAGSAASRLFLSNGSLVRYDVATGEIAELVKGRERVR